MLRFLIPFFSLTNLFISFLLVFLVVLMDKNFGFFGRYFAEISFFGEPRKEKCTEISFVRFFPKISDFFRFFPIISDKYRYFSYFFRYFSEISDFSTVFSFCYFASKISKNCFWWDLNPPKMHGSDTLQPPSH